MKYLTLVLLLLPAYYLFSFAAYTWEKNKLSSIGAVILALVSIAFPAVVFFTRR
jgi:hypothetical protein